MRHEASSRFVLSVSPVSGSRDAEMIVPAQAQPQMVSVFLNCFALFNVFGAQD